MRMFASTFLVLIVVVLREPTDFQRTNLRTVATLYAVGIQIAILLATTFVRSELHRAYTRAHLAFLLTGITDMNCLETFRERSLARSNPFRQTAHRTERAPCAGSIYER